jgi:hypothetical protein
MILGAFPGAAQDTITSHRNKNAVIDIKLGITPEGI